MAAYAAYTDALKQAAAAGSTATFLRPMAAQAPRCRLSQLGGYYLIDVADLDAAKSWAARCPATGHGAVEVRAVWA